MTFSSTSKEEEEKKLNFKNHKIIYLHTIELIFYDETDSFLFSFFVVVFISQE